MKVTITKKCSRCKRESQAEIDSTEIAALEEEETRRTAARQKVEADVAAWPQKDIPEVIVYFRGKLQTIDTVCMQFCEKTVQNQVEEIFREIDSTKRKPRTKKEKVPGEDKKADDKKADKKGKAATKPVDSEVQGQK